MNRYVLNLMIVLSVIVNANYGMDRFLRLISCGAQPFSKMDECKDDNVNQEQDRVDYLNNLGAAKLVISLSEGDNSLVLTRHLNKFKRNEWTVSFENESIDKKVISYSALPIVERNQEENKMVLQRWKVIGLAQGSATLVLKELDAKKHVVQSVSAPITVVK